MKTKKVFVYLLTMIIVIGFATLIVIELISITNNKKYFNDINSTKITNNQNTYVINLTTFEKSDIMFVSFYITNNNLIIYEAEEQWRLLDFHGIKFNDNNDVVVMTGDTGENIYIYTKNKEGMITWVYKGT